MRILEILYRSFQCISYLPVIYQITSYQLLLHQYYVTIQIKRVVIETTGVCDVTLRPLQYI